MTLRIPSALLLALALAACGGDGDPSRLPADAPAARGAGGRDQIRIVGSSTVYPFSTRVAETFGRETAFKTPVVESTGTGGGFKLFCAGVGEGHPDLTNASRAIKDSEVAMCRGNGVTEITEVKIGYDGIVVASARSARGWELSREELYLALAKQVPKGGEMVPNPHRTWRDVDPRLPAVDIEVLGPPPTSGTRDAYVELVMEPGCEAAGVPRMLDDEELLEVACKAMREDGAFVEAGENDNLIVQKLTANPDALGIFGFSFLDQNLDKVQGARIDGVAPTFENIAAGAYPVSRPLFIYVKAGHAGVIPGLREYVAEYVSDAATGEEGYLTEVGLIPLPAGERQKVVAAARSLAANVG